MIFMVDRVFYEGETEWFIEGKVIKELKVMTNLVHISAGVLIEFVVGAEDYESDLAVT